MRFFTISSLRHELSSTRTLKWPWRNRVQITCNTSGAHRVQHVVLHATWYLETAQHIVQGSPPCKSGVDSGVSRLPGESLTTGSPRRSVHMAVFLHHNTGSPRRSVHMAVFLQAVCSYGCVPTPQHHWVAKAVCSYGCVPTPQHHWVPKAVCSYGCVPTPQHWVPKAVCSHGCVPTPQHWVPKAVCSYGCVPTPQHHWVPKAVCSYGCVPTPQHWVPKAVCSYGCVPIPHTWLKALVRCGSVSLCR